MSLTISKNAGLLQHLGTLNSNNSKDFKIIRNHGHSYSLAQPTPKMSFLKRLFKHLFSKFFQASGPKPSDDYKLLKSLFEEIADDLSKNVLEPEKKQQYQALVENAFNGLKHLYERYRHSKHIQDVIKRNDILEAVSTATRKEKSLNTLLDLKISRVKAALAKENKEVFENTSIPLIDYPNIETATRILKTHSSMSLQEMQKNLKGLLHQEDVPLGYVIDIMYRYNFLRSEKLNRAATWYAGQRQKSNQNISIESIAKFFKGLRITLETEFDKELYAYSEVFQTDLRHEKSLDSAFQRKLTPHILQMLLCNAHQLQEKITRECGSGNIVIANCFNRLTMHHVGRNGAGKKFNITGKKLNNRSRLSLSQKKNLFSIQNILGNEDGVDTSFLQVVKKEHLTSIDAQRLLLNSITNMIDSEDVTLFIKRLAPPDIHRFVMSAPGTILSKEETSKMLGNILQQKIDNNSKDHMTAEALMKLKNESLQLTELCQLFANQSSSEKSQATINIKGTQRSVNRKALYEFSGIPAQNTRKIMMVRHEDGSLALHIFVGATAVDFLHIGTRANDQRILGEDIGSMGVGSEVVKKSQESWLQGLATRADSMKIFAKAGSFYRAGEEMGVFDKSGSTIVSIYFNKDFIPLDKLQDFTQAANYRIIKISRWARIRNIFCRYIGRFFGMKPIEPTLIARNIELKTQLGDVIGLPKNYVAMQTVKKVIGSSTLDELIKSRKAEGKQNSHLCIEILDLFKKQVLSKKAQLGLSFCQESIAKELEEALDKEPSLRNEEENYLVTKVSAAIEFYINKN